MCLDDVNKAFWRGLQLIKEAILLELKAADVDKVVLDEMELCLSLALRPQTRLCAPTSDEWCLGYDVWTIL